MSESKVVAIEQLFEVFGSLLMLVVPGKIGLDRVRDRVKNTEIKLKIEFTHIYSLELNQSDCTSLPSKSLGQTNIILSDPDLSRSII